MHASFRSADQHDIAADLAFARAMLAHSDQDRGRFITQADQHRDAARSIRDAFWSAS